MLPIMLVVLCRLLEYERLVVVLCRGVEEEKVAVVFAGSGF